MIPRVETSVYFHSKDKEVSAFKLLWNHFKSAYKNSTVIMWSIFYSISFCLYFQSFAYIQVLWLSKENDASWNASVDAIFTLSGVVFAIVAGKIQISFLKREKPTLMVLIIMSSLQGVIIILASKSSTLLQCYLMFILYGITYALSITITATKIAENLCEDSYGLVFGFNTFLAVIIQTGLTFAVVSNGFMLSIEGQFLVYGFIYIILGGLYSLKLIYDVILNKFA